MYIFLLDELGWGDWQFFWKHGNFIPFLKHGHMHRRNPADFIKKPVRWFIYNVRAYLFIFWHGFLFVFLFNHWAQYPRVHFLIFILEVQYWAIFSPYNLWLYFPILTTEHTFLQPTKYFQTLIVLSAHVITENSQTIIVLSVHVITEAFKRLFEMRCPYKYILLTF